MTMLVDPTRLKAVVARIFAAAGSGEDEARIVAGHLVLANLVGHDSHGVIRRREYLPWLERSMVRANRHAEIVFESAVALQIDGGLGFGQVIGLEAMRLGIAKARRAGLAVVGIRNTGHLGRIGHWAEVAAEAGLVSLHFVNTSGFGILTAPFGGREARLSANPIAAGVPRQDAPPVILDMSTASIAEGKIKVALNAGMELPGGAVIDAAGGPPHPRSRRVLRPAPRRDPAVRRPQGLRARGDCRGARGRAHGRRLQQPGQPIGGGAGQQHALDLIGPDLLGAGDAAADQTEALVAWLKGATPARPGGEILLPGEVERRTRHEREEHGIPLDSTTLGELEGFARAEGAGFQREELAMDKATR